MHGPYKHAETATRVIAAKVLGTSYFQPSHLMRLRSYFKSHSKHATQILDCKAAGKRFKAYALCSGSYLFDLKWSAKTEGISGLALTKTGGCPETQAIVVQMLEHLPHPWP